MPVFEFVEKWRKHTLTERAAAQPHFIDLCRVVGHPTPPEADRLGEFFTFEKGATTDGGRRGWADVWYRHRFAWEYKKQESDLELAYRQVQKYREHLENPPLLIVCDLNRFEVHTNFTGTVKQRYAFDLVDLQINAPTEACPIAPLDVLRHAFYAPERLKPGRTTEQVTNAVAGEFAKLALSLGERGHHPEQAAHFLMRILFCLFAEDVDLLENRAFTRLVEKTRSDPESFTTQVSDLFRQMATGGWFGADRIAHFNGGLFVDDAALPLTATDMEVLHAASQADWSSVEPTIFGTLFERGMDPSKRSQWGGYYTSRDDILLVVEPVLMAPIRRKWADVQEQAGELLRKRDQARTNGRKKNCERELEQLVTGFQRELAAFRILDPACGSGNFLYVALKLMLDLEKELITSFSGMTRTTIPFPQVGPEQLYGIEINPYAHELAQLVVWIGYIQWLRDNGFGEPAPPILKPLDNIRRMDAIIGFDDQGHPVEPVWPDADVLIGNPPFLGGNRIRQGLGDDYVNNLFRLYEGRLPAFADLVCYWFERARAAIADRRAGRAGLLATQAIRGGANRTVLDRIKGTGDIFWAWSDRNWVLDGAAVHISMVGFDDGQEPTRTYNGEHVSSINANLTVAADLGSAKVLAENKSVSFQGPSAKSPLDIDESLASDMLSHPMNVNGRPNSDVVKRVASATDLVGIDRRKWTIDFGLMPMEEASMYEAPFEYVKQHVLPIRSKNRRAAYAERWWQYAEPRPGMRRALRGKSRYIATACHAKHRIFVWVGSETLCNQATIVFARGDDYFFGVLHSRVHELWALRMGTALEDRPRYTPTSTFETFPLPWPPGREPKGDHGVTVIAEAARELNEKRERWLNPPGASASEVKQRTLTNLYNERPHWLQMAHEKLDVAVLAAYDWPVVLTDDELLGRLLELNFSRAGIDPHPIERGAEDSALPGQEPVETPKRSRVRRQQIATG